VDRQRKRHGETKKCRLRALLQERAPERIDEPLFSQLEAALSPISRDYLRQLLRVSDYPLDAWVRGVSLHSAQDLRDSLLAFAGLYTATEDHERRRAIRAEVIDAKTRLRALIARTAEPAHKAEREDMLLHVMTWLENPEVFDLWVRLKA